MKLILESMKIRNFKGIKEQDITFNPTETTICGENGTGKTTVVDAFSWLLFEKDSKGRAQFEIKTLTEDGEVIHGLDHSVEAIFKIDGRTLKLKKIYKEIWTLKKGQDQEVFGGHEIERFINEVPVKKSEYESKINELIDEKIFKLLTDPLYFSQQLHWKDRRKALFELAGEEITKDHIFKIRPELRFIEEDLEDKTIEELREALKYQKRQLNKEKEDIPVKIKTLHGTIKDIDIDVTETRIRAIKGSIKKIEETMLDATKLGEEQLKKQDELYKLKSRQKEIEYELQQSIKDPDEAIKKEIIEIKSKIRELEAEAQGQRRAVANLKKIVERGHRELEQLRADYKHEAEKTIEIAEDIRECPTCQRPFSDEEVGKKIAELEENFKAHQVKELTRLRDKGQTLAAEVKEHEDELNKANDELTALESKINTYQATLKEKEEQLGKTPKADINELLEQNQEYQNTRTTIEKLEAELKNRPGEDLTELKLKKSKLEEELKELEKDLHQDEINQETRKKIEDLLIEEKALSQKIGEIEKKETIADKYTDTQAKLIEESINGKFDKVAFRLFKKQTNGGLDDTCEVLVDGVPFDNANTAGQVNAGLDIINSLCRHYNMYTPIFIDNRESVNELIDTDSQLINLKVTKHKNLRVEVES